MLLGDFERVSVICLLLFSSAACFPATKGGYVSPPGGSGSLGVPVQPQPAGGSSGSSVYEAPSPPSGFAYPAGNVAATYDSGPASFGSEEEPLPDTDAAASYPLPYGVSSGPGLPVDASLYDPSNWMPSRPFPDLSVWDSGVAAPQSESQETSPLAPSSYIIQSRSGFQRAREVLSHSKYSPEYPEPPPPVFRAVKAPSSKSPPASGSKGGYRDQY